MIRLTSKFGSLALTAAVFAAAMSTGCSQKGPQTGSARISVSASTQAILSQISEIDLSIDQGTPALAAPITAVLTKAANGTQWTASVGGIPTGTGRVFTATALNGTTPIYRGQTNVAITAGGTAIVVIILQELNVPPGPTNYAPVISAISSSDSLVVPGSVVTLAFAASDPDNNYPLAYVWGSTCTGTGGNGTFAASASGSLAAATTNTTTQWTAPGNNGVTCTLSIKVTDSNTVQGPSSVQTFLSIDVNTLYGNANVNAYPNSWPIVTQYRGDFQYNYFASVGPVHQTGNLFTTAIDPDGDDIRYDFGVVCGTTATNQTPGLSFATQTVASGTASNPTWVLADPSQSCVFTVNVHDLCTNNNCGANLPVGTPGRLANGGDRGGSTVGIINATAPAQPRKAPYVVRANAPNKTGPTGQTVINPSTAYNFSIDSTDPEGGNLTIAWSANTGTVGTPSNSGSIGNLHALIQYTSPATLLPVMTLTAAITSDVSHLTTTVTFNLIASDPCVGQADATVCSTGNLCVTGETCTAGHCGGGSAVVCAAANQCQSNVCNPNSGCGTAPKAAGVSCNADSNGCTVGDSCAGDAAGTCNAGAAPACNTPADAQCQSAVGTCQSTGNSSFVCNYTAASNGTACNADSNGCTQNDSCQAGACAVGPAVVCSQSTNTCQAGSGTCVSTGNNAHSCQFGNLADNTACNTAGACVTGQVCTTGVCSGGAPFCSASQSCNPVGPTCTDSIVGVQTAKDLQVSPPEAVATDSSGATYVAGAIFSTTPISFDGHMVQSSGDADIFLAKYDPVSHSNVWAKSYGDTGGLPQSASGTAITKDGTLVAIGNFSGQLTFGTSTINSTPQIDFVAGFDATNGAGKWAQAYNDGLNGKLTAVGANPNSALNRIAVCGYTDGTGATTGTQAFVPGATFGGGTKDLIVGVLNSSGTLLWSKQIGAANDEECDAISVDDNGDVYATGKFTGALSFTGPLTGPATANRAFVWVAKFNGATGAALSQTSFGNSSGKAVPTAIAVDAAGKIAVGGNFTIALPIGAVTLTSAGALDAFVTKLDPAAAYATIWAVRLGGIGADSVNSVAVTSFGDVLAVGVFSKVTSGAAVLSATGGAAPDAFLLKLSGATGATAFSAQYGDNATQSADSVAVNRFGTGSSANLVSFVGTLNGSATFPPPAGTVTAVGATDAFLVFGALQ